VRRPGGLLFAHDLFGKPLRTFPGQALIQAPLGRAGATSALG
jgi:hypothetical protein